MGKSCEMDNHLGTFGYICNNPYKTSKILWFSRDLVAFLKRFGHIQNNPFVMSRKSLDLWTFLAHFLLYVQSSLKSREISVIKAVFWTFRFGF